MSSDSIINRFTQSLEGLPKFIASALTKHGDDIKERVEKEIEKIIAEFDVESAIRNIATPLLRTAMEKAIHSHFESLSGQQALNNHIESILKGTAKITQDTKPADEEDTVPAPETTKEINPLEDASLFDDPLSFSDIKELLPYLYPITALTPAGLAESLQQFKDNQPHNNPCILIEAKDAYLLNKEPLSVFFEARALREAFMAGQVGTILGMEVYGDFMMKGSLSRIVPYSGFLNKPTEKKAEAVLPSPKPAEVSPVPSETAPLP